MDPNHLVSVTGEGNGHRENESLGSLEGMSKQKSKSLGGEFGRNELSEKLGQGLAGQRLVCAKAQGGDSYRAMDVRLFFKPQSTA